MDWRSRESPGWTRGGTLARTLCLAGLVTLLVAGRPGVAFFGRAHRRMLSLEGRAAATAAVPAPTPPGAASPPAGSAGSSTATPLGSTSPPAGSTGLPGPTPLGSASPRTVPRAVLPPPSRPRWWARTSRRRRRGEAAALVTLGILLIFLMVRRRRRGDLSVVIELPGGRRGTFSVRLTRYRERRPPRPDALEPEARASTRFEHFLVARETHFQRIPARTYIVMLEGIVETPDGTSKEAVLDDREVEVAKGRTARVLFDLRPRQCFLEVQLVRGGQSIREGRVAIGGDPTSLRLARDGVARLSLGTGQFQILAGAQGCAAERSVEIADFEPRSLVIDLDDAAGLVFSDCDAAVDPFLRGDLSVVAAALERSGQRQAADLLAARFHQDHGDVAAAASRFEAAGELLEAARLRAAAEQWLPAAELFERGGAPDRAAEMFRQAGDFGRAGRAHEMAGDLEAAADCYRRAGDRARLLDVLEKDGDPFEAGALALEQGEDTRALRSFQQVEPRHPRYWEACRRLADLFQSQGKLELAVQKAEEAVTFSRTDEASPDTLFWYADLLESAGRPERALRVFEELAETAPERFQLTTRIRRLREAVSAHRREGAASGRPHPFGAESRYELLEEIGAGGMGVVYRALDRRLGREVALKRLPENLKDHPHAVELFLREARAAAALNHPNIVTLHDVDEEDGIFFLTMELLVGSTLADVVADRGRVSPPDTVRLGMQIAAGLGYAHAHRIVHRDVKLANLFFTRDRVVKIMDFGLAKMLEEVRRATTVVGGTPYAMAPEQTSGGAVDHRADLYSLGVALFELLTGHRPFEEGDVAYHHRHTPAPDPRVHGVAISDELAALVLRLLAKSPDQRIQSAEQVGQALQALGDSLARRSQGQGA